MGALGDGVTPDGRFVPFTLPGERVEARREGDGLGLERVIEPSPQRVQPPCPHFGACGGCALQHWRLDAYRAWKVDQVRLALARARMDAPVDLAFAAEPGSRRRLSLHARKVKGGAAIGFKQRRSWTLTPIDVCPIADPRIERAFPALRRLAEPCLAHPKSAPILHVTLTETGLDVDVSGVMRGTLSADARLRLGEVAREAGLARVTVDGEIAYQARAPVARFGAARVALPPGGFLQAVAAAEEAMADLVVKATAGARRVADLYCGAGAFTFRLAEQAGVIAADASAEAIAALRAAQGTATGLKPITAETRDLDRRPLLAADLAKVDAVVFDPPRAGAAVQSTHIAASKVPVVVAVSCNPATFVRDAETLMAGGYRLQRVAVVDQFLWSPHIELVARFSREGDFQKA